MDALIARSLQVEVNGYKITLRELTISELAAFTQQLAKIGMPQGLLSRLSGTGADQLLALRDLLRAVPGILGDILTVGMVVESKGGWWKRRSARKRFLSSLTANQAMDLLGKLWELNDLGELFQRKLLPLLGGAAPGKAAMPATAPLRN